MAGRGALGGDAQTQCVDRLEWLEPEILSKAVGAVRQYAPEGPILFGSDYPLITPDRWMKDFEEAGFKPEVMPGILKGNAVRLLGLAA